MTQLRYQSVQLTSTDAAHEYAAESGTITLDENQSPFLQANITVTLPLTSTGPGTVPVIDQAALDYLDPDANPDSRLTVAAALYLLDEATGALTSQDSITASLAIENRTIDWAAGTVALALATDEFELQKQGNDTAEATNYRAHQASLVAVVNAVLADAGLSATLDASSLDADVTTLSDVTNMLLDPSLTGTANGGLTWSALTPTFGDTSWSAAGGASCLLASPTAADSFLSFGESGLSNGMQAGKTYTVSAWGNVKSTMTGNSTSAGRERAISVVYNDSTGTHEVHSAQVPNTVNTPTRVSVTFTLPDDATLAIVRLYLGNTAGAIRWDAVMLTEGDGMETSGTDLLNYFDGSTPEDEHYTYLWDGTPNASNSHRVPLIDRSIDSLTLSPGQTYWDMLNPVAGAAGLRLMVDEFGAWRLIDGTSYALPGTVIAQLKDSTAMTDTVDLTDTSNVAKTIVVKYTWIDADGNTQTAYDAAGSGGPMRTVEIQNRPYPGPGRAAYLLALQQGKGRVMSTTVLNDFSARPYMAARIITPYTQTQIGVTSAITFDITSGEMQLTTRGLTGTAADSWDFVDDALAWDGVNDALAWDDVAPDLSNLT